MPNRILKESIRTSKSINAMTDFQFRLWAYLITYVDDFGRGSAEPDILKGFVFPRRKCVTEATIKAALSDLANMGLIHLYEVDGDSYLCLRNWEQHQKPRAATSKFPAPPENDSECMQMQADASRCSQMQADAPDIRYSINDTRYSDNDIRESTRKRFTPPTIEEVLAYAVEKGWSAEQFDAVRFVDFYASKGWYVGKNPMKDWKAAARGWVSRGNERQTKAVKTNPALEYNQREYKADDYGDDFFIDLDKYGEG